MSKVIGIDLGTTNSCVAVMEGGVPVVISNAEGGRTTPSIVAFAKNGERLVGDPAKRQAVTNVSRTVASVKRQMGTDRKVKIDGKKYTPEEISAMILAKLKKDAESYLGEEVTRAVITVPAYFSDAQRQATKNAGKIAGLSVERIINEPTSAALAYGLDKSVSQKIMVYDLGGGTFDVSVIEIGDGVVEVLATAGNNHLGGDDFDQRIMNYLIGEFKKAEGIDLSKDQTAVQRIKEEAEKAKKELSSSMTVQINLPFIAVGKDGPKHMDITLTRSKFEELTSDLIDQTAVQRIKEEAEKAKKELSSSMTVQINLPFIAVGKDGPKHMDITLTRSKFEELTSDLIDQTAGPVHQALSDAGISTSELHMVLLVGGSTRMPAVSEKVRQLTGKEPSKNMNPDECVALGAAIQGGKIAGEAGLNEILLMDVTPLSLSIETAGGVATRLIDRNSTIPTRYSQIFTTAANFQTTVEIKVLQGERAMARDNQVLGTFKLKGIKRAMRGVPQIEVTFDIDVNGILNVSAKDLATGKEQSITITASSNMSDKDIERAMEDAKAYESEDQEKRDAIGSYNEGENMLYKGEAYLAQHKKELSREQRSELKSAISDLKHSMKRIKPQNITEEQGRAIKEASERVNQLIR